MTIASCRNKTPKTDTDMKNVDTSPQTGYAPVNGIKMYYELYGEGDPLVLIHGGGSTIQTSFENIIPLLAVHYKVIAVELQAHGRTSDRDAPESFEQDADDVAALLKHLAIDSAHIMGFSNGGNTTMQIGIRHPALVKKLVIISAFYKREGMFKGFFEMLEKAVLDEMPRQLRDAYLSIPGNDSAGLLNMFNKDRMRMVQFNDWTDEMLSSIKAPSLVVSGDKDVASNEHMVAMSRIIPHCELLIVPGTHGSFIGQDMTEAEMKQDKTPAATIAIIEAFLGK
jgi:pimeloyl-ACP methyl ester carboxylesterase